MVLTLPFFIVIKRGELIVELGEGVLLVAEEKGPGGKSDYAQLDQCELDQPLPKRIWAVCYQYPKGHDLSILDILTAVFYCCKKMVIQLYCQSVNASLRIVVLNRPIVLNVLQTWSKKLNSCISSGAIIISQPFNTKTKIDGEDGCEFIVGLADNIGLESSCASRIVVAAAAPTHSWLLQAWVL
ncbi:hypothetical protein QVD17_24854 [Tagetes erecta]|uniref:Uncharacterized protein n=1 Tax=Tagetes erecta TaxID=13708 RepID=A0AAD8KIC7_TARER|nr:hypothetical protein QVD17_24854 [Tagetes erecta]